MREACGNCDKGEHDRCDGIARVIDQDGHSRYVCRCYCRYAINSQRESDERVGMAVARLRRELAKAELVRVSEALAPVFVAPDGSEEGWDTSERDEKQTRG